MVTSSTVTMYIFNCYIFTFVQIVKKGKVNGVYARTISSMYMYMYIYTHVHVHVHVCVPPGVGVVVGASLGASQTGNT